MVETSIEFGIVDTNLNNTIITIITPIARSNNIPIIKLNIY